MEIQKIIETSMLLDGGTTKIKFTNSDGTECLVQVNQNMFPSKTWFGKNNKGHIYLGGKDITKSEVKVGLIISCFEEFISRTNKKDTEELPNLENELLSVAYALEQIKTR